MNARKKPISPKCPAGLQPRLPFLQQLVRLHFPSARDASILDLGCGHGALMFVLDQAGYYNVRGVDVSIEQVRAAREMGVRAVEHNNLIDVLEETEAGSQDVIVTIDVIEHFTKSELVFLVEKVRQALRPKGRWIIHTPNGESPFAARMRYGDFTHETIFTRTSLCQMLQIYGFPTVHCYEDKPVPHGLKSLIRYVLWELLRALLLLYFAVETGELDHKTIFTQNFTAVAYI